MKAFLKTLEILSTEDLNRIDGLIHHKKLKKGEYLIREGWVCKEIAWIKKGMLRSFWINKKGDEITNCIAFDNEPMAAFSSYITQLPTEENIQAMCDVELEMISKTDLLNLYKTSSAWQEVGRILTEMQYLELEKRVMAFQKMTAVERYQQLLLHHERYLQFISVQNLASYLGITTRHLNRIRKQVAF